MRSIAEQGVDELGGAASILVRQRRDHGVLESLLTELEETPGPEQGAVLTRLCRLVFPHAFAEESVLWPVVRAVLPDGEALTLRVEQEHQEVNEAFTRLEQMGAEHPDRPALVRRIAELLRLDVRDEEDDLLPGLQLRLSPAELRRLGHRWELVRRVAPTRAHPVVSRRPPGNVLAALPLTVLDRTRDRVDQVARHVPRPLAPGLDTTSRGLGRVGRTVERAGWLRAGERRETRRPGSGEQPASGDREG